MNDVFLGRADCGSGGTAGAESSLPLCIPARLGLRPGWLTARTRPAAFIPRFIAVLRGMAEAVVLDGGGGAGVES